MGWKGHVARTGQKLYVYKIMVGSDIEDRYREDDDIKMELIGQ
jgi:hypothetical protein